MIGVFTNLHSYFCPVVLHLDEWIRWFLIGIICHISWISIGQFNAHTAGQWCFLLCCNNFNQGLSFCHVLAALLHISNFLPFCRRPPVSIFFCLLVFRRLPPSTYFNLTETTLINYPTSDLKTPCKHFNVKETLKIQASLFNSSGTSAYKTPSICGNPAEHT